jgi:tetratricopeptide (TPR) repeat protein
MASRTLECLLADLNWALRAGLPPHELLPMVETLCRSAPQGSTESQFARLKLAELLVGSSPFRSARLAREVAHENNDPAAWAVLGVALTVLGHYRTALTAHQRSLALAPDHPAYNHNLGHLLDVGLGRPYDSLLYLRRAHLEAPDVGAIASSYAHALAQVGRRGEAIHLLTLIGGISTNQAVAQLESWNALARAGLVGPHDDR